MQPQQNPPQPHHHHPHPHAHHAQTHLPIHIHNQTRNLPFDSTLQNMKISQFKTDYIRQHIGYSSRVFLYKQPLCSFNRIGYLGEGMDLGAIGEELGSICFTYNNTQYMEEPDYNHQPIYSRPPSQDSIETIVQICQNNYFVHETYRVQPSTRIGFFHDACSRYGRNLHVQYYNTRVNLSQFSNNSLLSNTISQFTDYMNRLTITVDSVDININQNAEVDMDVQDVQGDVGVGNGRGCLQRIRKQCEIQRKFYFKMWLKGEGLGGDWYVVSRRCKVKALRFLLKIVFKQEIKLVSGSTEKEIQDEYVPEGQEMIIGIGKRQSKRLLQLRQPIQHCQIIGQIHDQTNPIIQIALIQSSSILHILCLTPSSSSSSSPSLLPLHTHLLPCPPTNHLDQDLFFLRNNHLLSYSISITMIKVKYYDISTGKLLMLKVFPWYHDLYEIQFVVVDLFCVRIKNDKKRVRVFWIYQPEEFVEVGVCQRFFPARLGNNVYSDGSGLFASTNNWCQSAQIYQTPNPNPIQILKLPNYKHLTDIFFSQPQNSQQTRRKVILNYGNKELSLYSISTGQNLINILCEKGMNNFMCVGADVVACTGSQMRVFGGQIEGQEGKEKEDFKWGEPAYVPEKCAIVLRNGKVLIREPLLEFNSFSRVYLYQK